MATKTYILNIGGFDPCNGAGITADLKTFTALGTYALSVQTCLTIQNESEIRKIYWFTLDQIKEQIVVLAKLYQWKFVKISLTNGLKMAEDIIAYLSTINDAKIIWDPVMRSSSGYDFYRGINAEILDNILHKVYLTTPNWEEIARWEDKTKPLTIAARKARITNIYLKGGHNEDEIGVDYLFLNTGKIEKLVPEAISQYQKHGSGCVFGSALTAFLALNYDLKSASAKAKNCVLQFLDSNETLLGYHCPPEIMSQERPERFQKPFRSGESTKLEASQYYHIYNRGNNMEILFKEDDNYVYFKSLIGRHILPMADIYAYCLLPNHFHLVIRTKDKNEIEENLINDLSQPFSNLFNAYSKAYNKKYDRIGSLFQKPFRRKLIDSNHYLLDCIAYVNTNAQHHNLCESDGEYEYSSYQSTIEGNDVLVDAEKCIELFDGRENFINIHDEKKLILNEEFEN
ncbi:MAG: hydroxymethylpyrimidine/phosphomethylpyrimidine kinase [Bacteroidetes bacterium]|nr:hydroxymethylpyrimidine/phosphomethylpyrimidine kinase [Bacteroidota bacterium]